VHHLALDANTYLNFYSLTPSDVEELEKLIELIKLKKLVLYIPDQVVDEVRRNRARVVGELLKPVREARLQVPLPAMSAKSEESEALKKALADAKRAHSEYLEELTELAVNVMLPADRLIGKLYKAASLVSHSDAFEAASRRKARGNPPGKKNSLGDGIIWETLLAVVPDGEDLCLVSSDGDFASAFDPAKLDEYLRHEWKKQKGSDVRYYRDIKSFLSESYPDIHLTSDVRKYFLIDALINSTCFADTHSTVSELANYDSFSLGETVRLLTGSLENSQVRWLARDDDVRELLLKVIGPHRTAIPKLLLDKWEYLLAGRGYAYGPPPTEEDLAEVDEK
jgi:hypothetical protein